MATSPAASSSSMASASPYYRKQFRLKEPLVIATSDTESDSGSASADSPSVVGSSSTADHWHAALRHLQRHEQFTSGAAAVRHVAANTTDTVFLYPLLNADANTNNTSTDNRARQVTLEIRAGAADAVRGALAVGTTASALIPSQTLPLFLPNLFAIAQAGHSAVFHVACEALSKDLAVGSSYEAVYALQHAGALLLNASSPQELHDLSVVAHVAALRLRKLVVHFFDGARVAKEHAKINVLSASSLQALADLETASAFAAPVPPTQDVAAHVQGVMDDLFPVLQTQYNVYEYFGSPDAEHLVVVVGEASASLRAAVAYEQMLGRKVGVVQVRLLLPWSHALFAAAVPVGSIKRVAVLENVSASAFAFQRGLLSQNVQAFFHAQNLEVQLATGVYGGVFRNYGFSVGMGRAVLARLAEGDRLPRTSFLVAKSEALYEQALSQGKATVTSLDVVYGAPFESSAAQPFAQQFVFWRNAVGANDSVDHATLELLTRNPQTQVHALATAVAPSESVGRHGVAALEVRVGQTPVAGLHQGVEHADVVVVDDVALLKHVDVAAGVKPNGTLLVHCNWKTIDDVDESPAFKAQLAAKNATLLVVDLEELQTRVNDANIANVGAQVAFLKAANLYDEQVAFALLQRRFRKDQLVTLRAFVAAVWGDVVSIVYPLHEWRPASYLDDEDEPIPADDSLALPSLASLAPTKLSFQTSAESLASRRRHRVSLATQTAWKFVFRDAFAARHGVRDHVTDLVRVTKWERLTPESYERNVFHVEMDIAHSAIKYNIGEALAVFAHNDEHAVLLFLRSYNVDPDALVVLPMAAKSAKKGHAAVAAGEETLTYFQLFAQVLDIFGRPSKKFYQALHARATSDKEKESLALLLDNDGKDEYKRRVDETLTYADLLDEFVSARPSMDELVHLVPRIKPRHYSIASSIKMNPTSVHLLIVVHDWTTPSGVYKIGQATRFLSQVQPGQMLSVSVCSSVMKLPVNHADPIVMAGLGTGMAPFRAFIQERAFLKSKGVAVGPIALYFGARSKAQEFLYGEELEQYVADGLLTHLRCAFSRDQAHKIYIQDRIAEDKELLGDWLLNKNAHFYLCGPTWPVADVREALVGALMDEGALERKQANAYIERMREQGRYVLEVY